jgi:hypothetical protein
MYNAISKLKKLNDAVMSVVSGQPLAEGSKEEYEKFFRAALKKFGAKSPADLDDDKKKEFFNYVEKNYTGEKTDENFGQSAHKAKKEGKDTFEYRGKTYNVKESIKKYTFSVEEDDPDDAKLKKADKKTDLDSSEVEEEDGEEEVDGKKISKETINAVTKLLNKKRLENKEKSSKKSLQDEEEDDEEDGDEEKADAKVAKKSSETPKPSSKEEKEEEGKPPIKLSGKKDKVKVN